MPDGIFDLVLPQKSPKNHGQRAQLEGPAPPYSIGDPPTKQTPNERASQTHAHHKTYIRSTTITATIAK